MVSVVQRTYVLWQQGLVRATRQQTTRMGASKIPCNDAENSMSWKVTTRGTTAMLKIRELRPKKLSFQTSNVSMI